MLDNDFINFSNHLKLKKMKPSITLKLVVVTTLLLLIVVSFTFAQSKYEVKAGTFSNGEFTSITVSDTANSTKGSFKRALRDAVKAGKAGFSYKNQWYISGILVEKSTVRATKSELLDIKSDSTGLVYYFKTVKGGLIVKYDMPANKVSFFISKKILPSHKPTEATLVQNVYTTNLSGQRVVVKTKRTSVSSDEVRSLIKN
jgi:hypothetical protein